MFIFAQEQDNRVLFQSSPVPFLVSLSLSLCLFRLGVHGVGTFLTYGAHRLITGDSGDLPLGDLGIPTRTDTSFKRTVGLSHTQTDKAGRRLSFKIHDVEH